MASETLSASGQTGSICPQSGPYRSNGTAKLVIFIRKGDSFPPGANGAPTTWVLVTSNES